MTVDELKAEVGSYAEIARLAEVSKQAVGAWTQIPPERAALIERNSSGRFTRHQLCPDFPWDGLPPIGRAAAI